MFLRIISITTLCFFSNYAFALPQADPVPGGIALINIDIDDFSAPQVYFNRRQLMVHSDEASWIAVVGIPLNTSVGNHQIEVVPNRGTPFNLEFNLKGKQYESQYLTIKNKRQVNPNKKDLARISKEKKEMNQVYQRWTKQSKDLIPFIKPAQGPYSSPFGLKRFFNKQPRNPHSGIDIAAPEGSPIIAPADGIIRASGYYFFNGRTVLIDHGQGLVSMFCHMSSVNVQLGQHIKRGQRVGSIGQTGRATGPHLHWSVSLNNARVNPLLFLAVP
ncbi:MAG: peptidoglycan DD-metalloendopeptidase family protein [Pseudomonadales bacterium]|nr:peptidoglycan DD-metalloendopeptidase family protein [Pseudomonadales bacterium]